ncbi:MAG: histidinol-phosphatase HisJ family protein, partial [Bacteroidales bacterium]|nr:histidinol-phosphatase HisJ family protein [Bacteroidales bacterium]
MRFTDTHTHSTFSRDSVVSISQAAHAAIVAGLAGISFTDHIDIGVPEGTVGDSLDIHAQQALIEENIPKYQGRLNLYKGIEVGLQTHYIEEVKQLIASHRFDIVIGSVHIVNRTDPYYGDFYRNKSLQEAYREYLEYYIDCIRQFKDFDVLGHYDYISRYSPYPQKTLRYRSFPDQFDTLFQLMIENGKALELNTRSFVARDGQAPQFDSDVFKRFREMGGDMVTL